MTSPPATDRRLPAFRFDRWMVLRFAVLVLILKVTTSIVLNYVEYFPPNFSADFLIGRESYFFGHYQWAFYAHIVSSPLALLLGVLLISKRFRLRHPAWHRRLGRVQALTVLLLVAPSGLLMSLRSMTGTIASAGFFCLSLGTGFCVAMGWRTALQRRFRQHETWMSRTFALLCSAIILRLMAGIATVTGFENEWLYPFSAWASWLVPLVGYELSHRLLIKGKDV